MPCKAFQGYKLPAAPWLQLFMGADIFRIEPVTPYPLDHSELENIAQKEQSDNFRPEIAGTVEDIDQYDTIFFGFPNWYYDMPMLYSSYRFVCMGKLLLF